MTTILIKGISEELLKKLKKLKIELECKTWAELLEKLVESREFVFLSEEDFKRMKEGIEDFLKLKEIVSKKWVGTPTVLEEFKRLRKHE